MIKTAVAILTLLMAIGCSAPKEETGHKKEAKEEPISQRHVVIGSMPCFKCHDGGKFLNSVTPGVFSHKKHSLFDVHCNQCHTISGHMSVSINSDVCGGCHSLKIVSFEGGGMGKVSFNHGFHSKRFQCSECHPNVFPMKKGLKKIKMDDMYAGKSCGICHNGKRAFASMECALCHRQ